METSKSNVGKTVIALSLPLAALVITVSSIGLFTPGFYSAETLNWQAQSLGQDMIDLFLVAPCLLVTSILTYRNNKTAIMLWRGVVLYLTYTFALYCFDVHFNKLFILYCICLGLSFYSVLYFLFVNRTEINKKKLEHNPAPLFTGIYFIAIAVLFYFLWLAEIIPSIIQNKIPESTRQAGLFTNGVHVIDLSVILPAIFITGIFLMQRKPLGIILAQLFLSFFILMDITIGTLTVVMKIKGLANNLTIAVVMSVLTLISLILLIWLIKSTKIIRNQ